MNGSASAFDLILRGGLLVDPVNGVEGERDIGIAGGRVVAVADVLSAGDAADTVDVSGRMVMPGAIDPHVHLAGTAGRPRTVGHRMVAASGIVTALDLSCTPARLIESLRDHGAGLNVAGLFGLSPRVTLETTNPSRETLRVLLEQALADGAIGFKVLGAGVPMDPDAAATAIDLCNTARAYVAFHLGTSASGSNLTGVRELPSLLGTNRVQVAHVNSYCRGLFEDTVREVQETLSTLRGLRDRVVSESYLAKPNGCNGRCDGDFLLDTSARDSLALLGYRGDRLGLRQSMIERVTSVVVERGGVGVLVTGPEAADLWETAGTQISVSFPVNDPATTILCATAREPDGDFTVNALSTDGGVLPRNVLLEKGLNLVRYGAFSLSEFVRKASANAAAMLGLWNKGHLGVGADADITVLDLTVDKPVMSFNRGRLIMKDGIVLGRGGTLLVTSAGEARARSAGVAYEVIELARSGLYAPERTSTLHPREQAARAAAVPAG